MRMPNLLCLTLLFAASSAIAAEPNTIEFEMPADGWATIAINDVEGKRVRNLLANLPYKAGRHSVEWDGRDDAGEVVEPGTYQWVGLHRGDIAAVYRGAFQHGNPPWLYARTGAWTGDHSAATTVVAIGDRMLLGSNEAEWGHGLIACDADGRKQWGVKWLEKRSWNGAESLATVGGRAFATGYLQETAVWEIDPAGGKNQLVLERGDLPAELAGDRKPALRAVGGHDGELYVCDVSAPEPRTLVLRVGERWQRLTVSRVLPVRTWALTWLPDGRCIAALDHTVAVLDTATGQTQSFTSSPISAPWGITADKAGRVYVSDQGATGLHVYTRDGQLSHRFLRLDRPASHQVKVFDSRGNLLRAMGREGGQQVGPIDPESFFQPAGLAIDPKGRLWVTEFTQSPKRVSVWSMPDDLAAEKPTLVHQFFGPAHYGGGAAMIDPARPWRIMDTNFGVIFDVNIDTGAFHAAHLPWRALDPWKEHGRRDDLPFAGRPGVIIPIDGRAFTATQGGYMHGDDARWSPHRFPANGPTMIGEYVDDVFVPRAAIGNIRMWMRARELKSRREEQWLAPAILEAARRLPDWPAHAAAMGMDPDAPDVPHVEHKKGTADWIVHPWPHALSGFLWVDADGDAALDPDEVTFHPMGDSGHITLDGDLNAYWDVATWHKNEWVGTWKLSRDGFNAAGAPAYAWSRLEKISDSPRSPDHVAADGSMLTYTALHDAKGRKMWSHPYDNRGIRALGDQKHAVMKPGSVHRVNAVQGVVVGPGDLGQVYLMHSVDGMDYLMTRDDGLFIARVFRPYAFADGWDTIPPDQARPGLRLDGYSLQDECFNAHFVQAAADGQGFRQGAYYLLGNSRSAIVELTGLDRVERFGGGSVQLTPGAGLFGKGQHFDPAAATAPAPMKRSKVSEPLAAMKTLPGQDTFRGKPAKWLGNVVRAGWDDKRGLHLKWEVDDNSPFVNNEDDWTQLFTTGDACDLQVQSPTLGPLRFVIAMNNDKPVVVRMRYKGEQTNDAVTYKSDVATTQVPEVIRLDVKPNVRRTNGKYVVQVTLPWDTLGVPEPRVGLTLPMELGVCYSDPTGTNTQSREYWSSGESGMVADVPTEARHVEEWGKIILGE